MVLNQLNVEDKQNKPNYLALGGQSSGWEQRFLTNTALSYVNEAENHFAAN